MFNKSLKVSSLILDCQIIHLHSNSQIHTNVSSWCFSCSPTSIFLPFLDSAGMGGSVL